MIGAARNSPLFWIALIFLLSPVLTWSIGIQVAAEIAIFALYAVAFNLMLGYTGVLSFGHSLFFGMGAYAVGLIQLHVIQSSVLALILSVAVGAFVGLLVGLIIVKRNGIYFALLTLAFTQMVFSIVHRWTSFTGGETGLQPIKRYFGNGMDASSDVVFFWICAAVSFAGIVFVRQLVKTPFGHTLQGIRENEKRMKLIGCNTSFYKLAALMISAGLSALAGGLQTLLVHAAFPDTFNWQSAGIVVMMVVLGGSMRFIGPVIGSVVYIFLQYFVSSYTQHWMIVLGLIFVLVIMFLPDGLSSLARLARREALPPLQKSDGVSGSEALVRDLHGGVGGILSVSNLSKSFGGVVVADQISFTAQGGRILSLLGPNGAGKTTIFNIISGLLTADSGNISLNNRPITTHSIGKRAEQGLGRSLQVSSIFRNLTVYENIRLGVQQRVTPYSLSFRSADRVGEVNEDTWKILRSLDLDKLANEVAGELSHGDQRLIEIAITLGTRPVVLLLDEPLAGLSETERVKVTQLIRSLTPSCTILIVEHDVERVMEISDEIIVLHHGSLIAHGRPSEIQSNAQVQAVYLGDDSQRTGAGRSAARSDCGSAQAGPEVLSLDRVSSGYDQSTVLDGLSLSVRSGEVVGLLGRNGVGKTTTALTIAGILRSSSGSISYQGSDITRVQPDEIRRCGISLVPQGRRIFPNLTVLENLRVAADPRSEGTWTIARAFDAVPRLGERKNQLGRYLSGGEQQLLAICRALMRQTQFLILDEPTEGLSPTMIDLVVDTLRTLIRDTGISTLLIEQRIDVALDLTDRI